jgi:hypothetical protein
MVFLKREIRLSISRSRLCATWYNLFLLTNSRFVFKTVGVFGGLSTVIFIFFLFYVGFPGHKP